MASTTVVSVDEYLHTSYEPDCDYVDGELVERNVGEPKHSILQLLLGLRLREQAQASKFRVATELRLRVKPTRFRVPDLTVMLKSQRLEPALTTPPFLCVEIVSPDDRIGRIMERVREYLAFGVKYVWVIDPDPASRAAHSYTAEGGQEVRDHLTTEDPEISISLVKLFAELDEDLRDEA